MVKVYIFLAEGFEEVEALTVADLLRRAEIEVRVISIGKEKEVCGSHSIVVKADQIFTDESLEEGDMLILPGGMPGTTNLLAHQGLSDLIKLYHKEDKKLAAICAAPSVLGANGVLQGKEATCYPGFENRLLGAKYVEQPVVIAGNVITSRGVGTTIDFSLEIIAILKGVEIADKIKDSILY